MSLSIYDTDQCELIERVYGGVLDFLGLDDIFEAEISFVDEDTIREINRDARGVDSVTDVLSFPNLEVKFPFDAADYAADVDPENGLIILGEIVVCGKRRDEQAAEYGHSIERETAFLTVHGLLHLFGYDHMEEGDRAKMREAEESILSAIGAVRNV